MFFFSIYVCCYIMERRWLATSPLTSPGAKLARLPHTFANQSWENSCFFVKLYCVVLDCILGIATYWICALSKGGAYCMVYYLVLANILNKRYGLHRAGEIIFFVSLKLNSANGLSKYESVNHVTIKSIWPWKEKTLTCDCQSCDRKNIWWPVKDFSQLSVPWQQSSKNRKQLKI